MITKKKLNYPAHPQSISLPPLSETPINNKTEINIGNCHQQFIAQQTQFFYQILTQIGGHDYSLVGTRKERVLPTLHPPVIQNSPFFSRKDLEGLASGTISDYFGEWFKPLDQYERLIRMPEPPLLLTDRVTQMIGEPGLCKIGTICTETDILENSWYMHHGHMPAGIMIESGQADLLLASWLGFDQYNQGNRIYRLLGCELCFYDELPKPGDTLCFEISITSQAKQGDIRLFFFQYDCKINGKLRLKVRNGQAGFFNDQELAESGGVLWDAAQENLDNHLKLDAARVALNQSYFTQEQLKQAAAGKIYACFGKGFEMTEAHIRTPTMCQPNMLFIHEITHMDTQGGPNQRGYLRAKQKIQPDDWFFQGHFKNDPCMPGTLMFEAGLQVMSFYLTALGYTIDKDGWRFEPIPEQFYQLRCRGQVRPESKEVIYEIFIVSMIAEPIPLLIADLLASVDGLKAFHTKIGIRLIPDWPLETMHTSISTKPSACVENGFSYDFHSLLACALGKPSKAFGKMYEVFDSPRKVPRLPNPPYHFMSRVTHIQGDAGSLKIGSAIECEYDIPLEAWYFSTHHHQPTMPFCILLESALQPCGWLASYLGCALLPKEDVVFRNLDGTGTLLKAILPADGILHTHIKCTNIFRSAGSIITAFEVKTDIHNELVYQMNTVFGFFPLSAFENQPGLMIPEDEIALLEKPSDFYIDLMTNPPSMMSQEKLLMIDRVTGFWPEGGKKGLGQLRAEKTITPDQWFFKAHFFQDPVQPGSLGIEAMIQLLQFYLLQQNTHLHFEKPYFQALGLNMPLTWKYRGQVIPTNQKVHVTLDITEKDSDYAIADAALWVDGKRIYEAKNLGMKIIESV